MKNIFAVGTGPGASEYLTLQAVAVLKKADIVFAPKTTDSNIAFDTVSEFIKGKKVEFLHFPMKFIDGNIYKSYANQIIEQTKDNSLSVILTIGDPMIYSTFIYMMPFFKIPIVNLQVISGIPSAVAAAGKALIPLAVKKEILTITDHINNDILKTSDSIALLKTSGKKDVILNEFETNNFEYVYVKRATMTEEIILTQDKKDEILNEEDYISLILAHKKRDI